MDSDVWNPGPRHPIHTVEGGDLVTFRQRGVVEDCIDKIIDLAMKGHDGLTDVNQFRSSLADDMHTQQMPGVSMKQYLQHAGVIPNELSSGDFSVAGDADSIGHFSLSEFFLVPPYHGDFRNGINAVGKERRVGTVGTAEGVAGGVTALLH